MVTAIISGVFLAASIFLAVSSFCLRNFHRSRLAQVCRARRNEGRFTLILQQDERALHACDLLEGVTLSAGIAVLAAARVAASGSLTEPALIGEGVALVAGVWLLVVVFPWALSRVYGEQLLYYLWPAIRLTVQVARPLCTVGSFFDTLLHRLAGREDPVPDTKETIVDEVRSVIEEGEREGLLEARSGRMVQRVLELGEEDVRAVMTPRIDVITIPVGVSLNEARKLLIEAGHSRVPVIDSSPDDIVGILYARDLLEHIGNGTDDVPLRNVLREPFYVPETTTIDALLERMKMERLHLAIVLDEYGGVAGLVTLEDILEEIVGDIADEFDEAEGDQYRQIDPHTLEVDARMHVDELNDLFDLNLPEEADFDTVGGFVFHELGRIPQQGESFRWQNLQCVVAQATDRRVVKVHLVSEIPWAGAHPASQQGPLPVE